MIFEEGLGLVARLKQGKSFFQIVNRPGHIVIVEGGDGELGQLLGT